MQQLDLHCNIDEKTFSWVLFLTRGVVSVVLAYVCLGCLLHFRTFLYNAALVGIQLSTPLGIVLLLGILITALLLLLGWFTRAAAGLSVFGTIAAGFIFFAGDINRMYIALVGLLLASLLPSALLGPGKISLDYRRAKRHADKNFRG